MFSQLLGRDNNRASYWDSLPLQHANGRVLELVSGKSLGGSSRINAMLYTRGVPAQFNAWATAGRKGWSYDDMEPYFVKSEHHLGEVSETSRDFHGVSGKCGLLETSCLTLTNAIFEANGRTDHTLRLSGDILHRK